MDDEEVLKLISSGESEQVERKEQLKNKKPEVCQAICAFANDTYPRRPTLRATVWQLRGPAPIKYRPPVKA
jgi:predicted HTH transcriptional regulator